MATASPPGPSQLADTAAITLPKIDAIASGAVKDALKTGMSESEEVLEYLGGSVAYDLKAAAAKAATRRDLALGPKSKLDGAALNASMDELDRRAKAVAPFWVGPGVDDAPPQAAAAPALKKKAESPAKESAPLATATKAAAPTPAKPKPPPPKAELTPAKPKPPPPAPKKAPADAPKKMAMPELPKVKLPAVDVKLPSIPAPTIPVPELDGVAEDAIRAIRVAMSRAPKYDDDGDGDGDGAGFNFAPNVSDGIDKDDPDYREMVKTRRRRPPRAASLPAPPTPEEKEARRLERARLRRRARGAGGAEDRRRARGAAPARPGVDDREGHGHTRRGRVRRRQAPQGRGGQEAAVRGEGAAREGCHEGKKAGARSRVVRGGEDRGARPHRRRALRQVRHDRPG